MIRASVSVREELKSCHPDLIDFPGYLSKRAYSATLRARRILRRKTPKHRPLDAAKVLRTALEVARVDVCGHGAYSSTGLEDLTLCECSKCHHKWKVVSS